MLNYYRTHDNDINKMYERAGVRGSAIQEALKHADELFGAMGEDDNDLQGANIMRFLQGAECEASESETESDMDGM